MDRYEGHGRLDWWANSTTLVAGIDVSVVITTQGPAWEAHGRLANDEDREGFAVLCDLDPVFSFRFDDRSTITVTVHPADDHRQFRLDEFRLEPDVPPRSRAGQISAMRSATLSMMREGR
ncbi:hypothetical protein [Actinoplanes friuliensis]|uniref:hypothetical protein n=1 Tax=Actinoplanes friuliensis TaxID=196914 RepID=UPI0007C584E1|nr:hypothetical protein [Actinoplanes friuliensis]